MANEYFTETGIPVANATLASATIRAELVAIGDGFDKLPALAGNASKILAVNAGATALEAITTTGTGNGVRATSPTLTTPTLNSPVLVTPALGTPASGVATNLTGTAAGLTAGTVTTNANLTGGVTSVGNAATVVTNANLTGDVTSVGNAATVVTNANLTGDVTSVGNATTIGAKKVTLGMMADGTAGNLITYSAAGAAAAVATGAAGTVCTSNGVGAAPTFQAATTGALIPLSTVIANNSATVDIETTFNSTYDVYMLVINGLKPVSAGDKLRCLMKIGGSYVGGTGYDWSRNNTSTNMYNGTQGDGVDYIELTDNITEGANLIVYIFAPASTTLTKQISWSGSSNFGAVAINASGVGSNTGTAALTGLRFYASTGGQNLSIGTFRLYGIANS